MDFLKAEHCLICGDTHSGNCSPSAFVYFQCCRCTRKQDLPWDSMMFGLTGMTCGCGADAGSSWDSLTHEQWREAKEELKIND